MAERLIDAKELSKKLYDLAILATNRFVDTPYNSPVRERYRAQMDARRETLKMIEEAPTITPENLVRQEQQSGCCKFCNTANENWSDGGAHDFRLNGNSLFYFDHTFGWEGIEIKFCPMCGQKLNEEG